MSSRRQPTRREILSLAGSAAALGVWGSAGASLGETRSPAVQTATTPALSSCSVKPQLTQGPFFVDERLNRSDIRVDPADGAARPGVPVNLTMRVSRVVSGGCTPLAGVFVDLWQCDALGVYSDVSSMGSNAVGKKFLRGYQVTDANGVVKFTTIYPGWYPGRAVHIHFKIRNALSR